MKTQVLTVMFADLAGYTERTSAQSHEENAAMLNTVSDVIGPMVRSFGGAVVKELGDGFLAVFGAPTRAATAAMAIQDRIAELNLRKKGNESLRLRIALHVGEVRRERGDVFGEAVNITARIEAVTPADEIYLSETTYRTMNRAGLAMEEVGPHTLKGIAEPIVLYRLAAAEGLTGQRAADVRLPFGGRQLTQLRAARRRSVFKVAVGAAVLVAVGAWSASSWYSDWRTDRRLAALRAAIEASHVHEALEQMEALRGDGVEISNNVDRVLASLSASGDPEGACALLGRLEPLADGSATRTDFMTDLRLRYAFELVRMGEVARARVCLARLVLPEGSVSGRLLALNRIHMKAMEAVRTREIDGLQDVLVEYREHLQEGGAPDEHLALVSEIAVGAYDARAARPLADSMVAEYLGEHAVDALVERLLSDDVDSVPRAWILARLEQVAQTRPLDWTAIYAVQLDTESCGVRRNAIAGLRRLGRLSAVGLLMRESEKHDRCTRNAALEAAKELTMYGVAGSPEGFGPMLVATR